MSTDQLLSDFLLALQVAGGKPSTLRWYQEKLQRVLEALDKPLGEVTIDDLRNFIAALQGRSSRYASHSLRPEESGGLSTKTVHGYCRAIRRFFNWLVVEGHIAEDRNPAARLKLPRLGRQIPKGIAPEDLEKLLRVAKGRARDLALVLFLADTGARAGEVCGLKLEDLDLDQASAGLRGKGSQERIVSLSPATVGALREWLEVRPDGGEYVFTPLKTRGTMRQHLTPGGLAELLQRLGELAGVEGRCNPHSFRHGLARTWLINGGDLASLSEFLGHASVVTTVDYYGRLTGSEIAAKHRALSPVRSLVEAPASNRNGQTPVAQAELGAPVTHVPLALVAAPVGAAVAAPPAPPAPTPAASVPGGLVGSFSWTVGTSTAALLR